MNLTVRAHDAFQEYLVQGQNRAEAIQHTRSELLFHHKPDIPPAEFPNIDHVPPFSGIVGCWHVKMGVKTTDMCLLGQHIANMLANMLATQHKKLLRGVPLVSGGHVTCGHVSVVLAGCWMSVRQNKGQNNRHVFIRPTCCQHVANIFAPQSIELSN